MPKWLWSSMNYVESSLFKSSDQLQACTKNLLNMENLCTTTNSYQKLLLNYMKTLIFGKTLQSIWDNHSTMIVKHILTIQNVEGFNYHTLERLRIHGIHVRMSNRNMFHATLLIMFLHIDHLATLCKVLGCQWQQSLFCVEIIWWQLKTRSM